jgi:hypothetical protein
MNAFTRRFLWLWSCAVLLALVPFSAQAQYYSSFGSYSVGAPSGGLSGDYKRASRFELTEPATVAQLHAVLDGQGGPASGYQNVSLALYADANGVPGIKLAESDVRPIAVGTPGNWQDFNIQATPVPAGFYWIAIHSAGTAGGSTAGIVRDFGGATGSNWYGNSDTFSDGAASPFGAGSSGSGPLSLYASYLDSSLFNVAGRITVAATPSGGMTANFKRGSKISVANDGLLTRLSAYIDGKGASTGTQKIRYVLYHDAGGVPGAKVAQSSEITVKAGQAGSWLSAETPNTSITAGDYWIVIQSGDTGGIARNYGDGAANWYGNADTYSDGAASTFGSGSTGTVTLSAVAMVIPGTQPVQSFGRTSIATTPSGGLTANYSRGPTFGAYSVPNNGMMTAVYAYLDGNGGASGSQQARMVVYGDDFYKYEPAYKLYETETVTIPAGMSPRWVRFPLKTPAPFASDAGYWIMLQSGSTGGVIRDYGDGPANWHGTPDSFSDGGMENIDWYQNPNVTSGTVTMSTYIEFALVN